MTLSILDLRKQINRLELELKQANNKLKYIVGSCVHVWSSPEKDFIHEPAYTIPGDPPGTMGVDRQLPCHVPAKTIRRWKRVCEVCGEVQYTEKTRQEVSAVPSFG